LAQKPKALGEARNEIEKAAKIKKANKKKDRNMSGNVSYNNVGGGKYSQKLAKSRGYWGGQSQKKSTEKQCV